MGVGVRWYHTGLMGGWFASATVIHSDFFSFPLSSFYRGPHGWHWSAWLCHKFNGFWRMRASSIVKIGEDGWIGLSRLGGLWLQIHVLDLPPADSADWICIRLGVCGLDFWFGDVFCWLDDLALCGSYVIRLLILLLLRWIDLCFWIQLVLDGDACGCCKLICFVL